MAFSQGSRTSLSYLAEDTFGTTPSGDFASLPFTTHSLNLSKDRVQGNDIQSDRMPRHDRHGNRQAGGDISVDLRAGVFDEFLESAMFGTWDASPVTAPDELKVGTTLKSFSIEDYAADIDQARLFTGMAVSQAAFSIQPNQMVTTTFTMVGKDMTISATEETVTASNLNAPFDSYSGSIEIADQGGTLASLAIVNGIEFTIDNGLNPTFVIGSDSTPQLEYGRATIEGNITFYFEDDSLINRFLDETETAFKVAVDDPTGSNEYAFFFPRIKLNAADAPVENPQSRFIKMPFTANYYSTEESNLVIYRPDSS